MLTEQEYQEALHASRVVPLSVPNPHGPLGLDHLAAAVAQIAGSPLAPPAGETPGDGPSGWRGADCCRSPDRSSTPRWP